MINPANLAQESAIFLALFPVIFLEPDVKGSDNNDPIDTTNVPKRSKSGKRIASSQSEVTNAENIVQKV